jgi:hypothetical protein
VAAIAQAKRDSNAHFLTDPGYNNNCQRSIVAYELQRRGYRVTAMPAPADRLADKIKNGYECFLGAKSKKIQMLRASNGQEDLEGSLMRHKDGARFAIIQKWKDNESGPGHTYIAERVGNRIRYIDPQKGQTDVNYFDRVNFKDGKAELYFYRIDNAFLNPKIDFKDVVTPYKAKSTLDKADHVDIIYREDKRMTQNEARKLLETSEEVASKVGDNGTVYHKQVGAFYKDYSWGYAFVVYPYSSLNPVDLTYAFLYLVDKKNGNITRVDSPMSVEELKEVGGGK